MSEPLRILLVEDQEADAILIQRELRRQGLTLTVRRVDREETLVRALREFAPDVVISDFALPGFSGLEALAILRAERPGVPLIFVSGTVGEEQAVELLKLGATDYVLKDNLARLPASVSRALREVQLENARRRSEEQYRAMLATMEAQGSPASPPAGGDNGSRLPGGAAHDLNNLLAPIALAVSMLRAGLPEAERERMYAIIEHSARRAAEITRDVLAAAGRSSGESEWRPLEPGRVIKEVFQELQKTWPEMLRVKLIVGDDLWRITGDVAQIKRVVVDLCVHAGQAMPGGGTLRLGVSNQPADATAGRPSPSVVLEVSDTGGSITPRADGGPEPGLEAVWSIVARHGGSIRTTGTPGEGTTFSVFLPATREEPPPVAAAEDERRAGPGGCILLVDDEETIRFAARAVLSKHGYRVLTATDGAEALRVFDAHTGEIDLVLTDVMMPVMDGLALARALRERQPGIPIIASSGQNEKTRRAELAAAGVDIVLDKPYAAHILLRTVERAIQR